LLLKHFPDSQISVDIDVALGYRANFNEDRGIYLYAGTGSIAIYIDQDRKLRANGGWGYLLGDEGAGYWIGREALRQLLGEIESGKNISRIKEILNGKLAIFNRSEILKYAYGNSREDIARLAKPLIELAIQGDSSAKEITKSSAQHLSELVLRTEENSGLKNARIVFGGGVAQSGAIITSEIERILGRKVEVSKENLSLDAAKLALLNLQTTN
jgi:N-acetylglucosamine kinase-like BadF-type ATPase